MTTLNIEKSTRERINNLRRNSRTYDDIVNRMIDEITTLESFLPYPCREIGTFNRWLSEIDDPKSKLYNFLFSYLKNDRPDRQSSKNDDSRKGLDDFFR